MKYIDISTASKKWGISGRRIRSLCAEGRIDGAIKTNWVWTIPEDTPKPRDGRVIRKFKNVDIRPGVTDIDELNLLLSSLSIASELKLSRGFNRIIESSLFALLSASGINISSSELSEILSGRLVPSLSLSDHLLAVNFRALMYSFTTKSDKWSEKDIKESYVRLNQGIDDISVFDYRNGFSRFMPHSGENAKVAIQMENLINQYENSWKALTGIMGGIFLFGELDRIAPFDEAKSLLFAYIISSGELMRKGFLPPLLKAEENDEMKLALSGAEKRGNYQDITHFIERAIKRSYGEIKDV